MQKSMNRAKACRVTGRRDISADKVACVTDEPRKQIKQAVDDGFTMIFQADYQIQGNHPYIYLEAAYSYVSRMKNRSAADRALSNECVRTGIYSAKGNGDCYFGNRFMLITCEPVIVVYDGREGGGAVATIQLPMCRAGI